MTDIDKAAMELAERVLPDGGWLVYPADCRPDVAAEFARLMRERDVAKQRWEDFNHAVQPKIGLAGLCLAQGRLGDAIHWHAQAVEAWDKFLPDFDALTPGAPK